MENLESHEFKYFSLQAWEVMEFNCWSWKVMEIIVSVVGKLLQVLSKEKIKYRQVMSENTRKQEWVWRLNYHRERFRKLTFRALALRQSEWRRANARNDEGLTVETSAF